MFGKSADYQGMTCDNCGAPMHLDRDQGLMICDYCGSQMVPSKDEDGVVVLEPTRQQCPVCKAQLMSASMESCDMLYCTGCHGMLLDMDKLLPLLRTLREQRYWARSSQAPRKSEAERVLDCPLCGLEMDRHAYGGGGNVDVDSCEPCGVLWLDGRELSRMVAAPDRDPEFVRQSAEAEEDAKPETHGKSWL